MDSCCMAQWSPYGEILEMSSGYRYMKTQPWVRLRELAHGRSDQLNLGPATWLANWKSGRRLKATFALGSRVWFRKLGGLISHAVFS